MIPTLLGILFVSFVVVQFAPGGPVERVIAQLNGADTRGTPRVSGGGVDFSPRGQPGNFSGGGASSTYLGAQRLDPDFLSVAAKQFGLGTPQPECVALIAWA